MKSNNLVPYLISTCIAFGLGMLILLGFILMNHQKTAALQAELLQRVELQKRLLEGSDAEHCLYPHAKNSIAYVLNPAMGEGAFWAAEGKTYPINSLGLRGEEIGEKPAGKKRLLVVGDSFFFGYQLEAGDRLQDLIQGLLGDDTWEVLTVALPGWNVQSEAAFVESHLAQLAPDLILWETCPNDVLHTYGVVPPGVIAGYFSPQNPEPDNNAITALSPSAPPMPFTAGRFHHNLSAIRELRDQHQVPVLIAAVDYPARLWSVLVENDSDPIPVYFVPDELRRDRRAWVTPHDNHPSRWMNEQMAVAFLHRLGELELLPPIPLDDEQRAMLAPWQQVNSTAITAQDRADFLQRVMGLTPEVYDRDSGYKRIAVGLLGANRMSRHGVVYLRAPAPRSTVVFELFLGDNPTPAPRRLQLTVRNFESGETSTTVLFPDQAHVTAEAPIPTSTGPYPVYEVEWQFDFDRCDNPNTVYSAIIKRIGSR